MHRDGNGLFLANQDDKPLTAGNAGIEQITLQHRVMLRHDGDHHGWVFRALALMDGRRVGRYQGAKVAEAIGDRTPVEPGDEFAVIRFNILHVADVRIVDLLDWARPSVIVLRPPVHARVNGLDFTTPDRNHASASFVALPDMRKRLTEIGFDPVGSTPEEFAARMKVEIEMWDKVIWDGNIKAQ